MILNVTLIKLNKTGRNWILPKHNIKILNNYMISDLV